MSTHVPESETKDLLARAFLDILTSRSQKPSASMLRRQSGRASDENEQISAMLDDLSDEELSDANLIKPHIAAAAVLVARAIEKAPGLIRELKRGYSTVSIEVPEPDYILPVRQVLIDCALPFVKPKPRYIDRHRDVDRRSESFTITDGYSICTRDGSSKEHTSTKGNDVVADVVFRSETLIGIATDPKRHLPRDLLRIAEHHLRLPLLDVSALHLVIESATGRSCDQGFDEQLLRLVTGADLTLAIRHDRTPQQCLDKLKEVIAKKEEFGTAGPTLEELYGYGRAKEWGLGLVADMNDLKAGQLTWEDFDHRGLLLTGSPGTGKTSFARALAKSANIPIIATSVSEWNATGDHLGHTLQAMRTAFHRAQQASPSILFIDELDGISSRANLNDRNREYWLQVVNQLLELLQGFEEREGVVVIGATNHPDQIDPAVLRAGRLDRVIHVDLPDTKAMRNIYRFYLGDGLGDLDLTPLAVESRGKSGADVEAYVARAKAKARREKRALELADVLEAIHDGRPELPERWKRVIAVHEAGHSVANLHFDLWKLQSVELTRTGGFTTHRDEQLAMFDYESASDFLVLLMAGAAAEEIVLGKSSVGSSSGDNSDLVMATHMAIQLELTWQIGKPAPIVFEASNEALFLAMPDLRDRVEKRLAKAAEDARKLIEAKREQVRKIADALVVRRYLTGAEVRLIYDDKAKAGSSRVLENV
jgi:DNA polymerase III delta prime subunit